MQITTIQKQPWSDQIDPALHHFCKQSVLEPWEQVLEANRGERTGQIPPFMGLGPATPTWVLPFALNKRLIYALLGTEPNMVTIVLNQAHNKMIFFAAERAEDGKYLEMIRLDHTFSEAFQLKICRMLQTGQPENAMEVINQELERHSLERFKPGMLKITDISFFEAFFSLSKKKSQPFLYLTEMFRIANHIISHRLLYFYPQIPLEKLLSALHAILPKPRFK